MNEADSRAPIPPKGHTSSGAKVLLHLMAGSKEDAETVTAFFQDMRARGLDVAPGFRTGR